MREDRTAQYSLHPATYLYAYTAEVAKLLAPNSHFTFRFNKCFLQKFCSAWVLLMYEIGNCF